MSFTVVWDEVAAAEIDRWWSEASDIERSEMELVLEMLHPPLQDTPTQLGESREYETRRVVFCPPLLVYYRVDLRFKLVRVVAVRIVRRTD